MTPKEKKTFDFIGIYKKKVSCQNCHLVIASVYNSICLQLRE